MRWLLAFLASASMLLLVYASIVPLDFQYIPWSTAVERFKVIPWLTLSIDRRADWVANALVVIPSGFLAMGAIDWKRKSRIPALLMLPIIVLGLSAFVVGIEFLQLWFPGRTVSQNDIFAGIIGGAVGVTAWLILGRAIGNSFERFMLLPPGGPRIVWLIGAYTIGLFVYSVLPFDFVMTAGEWREKYAAGRLTVLPLSDIQWSIASLISVGFAAVRMIPIGLAARIVLPPRAACWSVILVASALELVQIPIFTRFASTTDVVLGILGGMLGIKAYALIPLIFELAKVRWLWWLAIVGWSGLSVIAFVGRFERIATAEEVQLRLAGLWVPPFVRYYFTSEFEAGANLLGKLIVFAALGFLMAGGGAASCGRSWRWLWTGAALFWTLALGMAIELLQVWLIPFIPDANDVGIYSLGALFGAILYGLLFKKTDDRDS
jgi:glycopeptide antibiotics resistance protein